MVLTVEERERAAALLAEAEAQARPVPPLVETFPGIDAEAAYEIALLNIRRRLAAGATVHGHKVGLTSAAMQQMMGVDEPDYGHLLSDMVCPEGAPVQASRYIAPRVEVEVGFVLGDDLPGEGCTVADVLRCTDRVVPAIELIDSRIEGWRITLPDTVADNASSAGVVTGAAHRRPADVDLAAIDATLHINGEPVAAGRSDAVLGHPAEAVAWLARAVARYGVRLQRGHLVLPGSCTRAYDVAAGDTVHADFTGLGRVSIDFE